ncbi:carbohydrate binding domain-containing protein [Paenibacillus sp. GCM10023252]|uniref:carbohydrate binding domain-containing protein n=1 Tax=Paenibacillus sp. GCM10023252 TaxID=3252649 RepID=UPI00360C5C68
MKKVYIKWIKLPLLMILLAVVALPVVPLRTAEASNAPASQDTLIVNASFEQGMAPWSNWSHADITSSDVHGGASALLIGSAGNGGAGQFIPLEPSKSYKLSFWGKVSSGSGSVIVKLKTVGEAIRSDFETITVSNTDYAYYETTFITPANTEYGPDAANQSQLGIWKSGTQEFRLDDFSLTETSSIYPAVPQPSEPAGALPTMADGNFTLDGQTIKRPDGQEFIIRGVNVNGPRWPWSRDTIQDLDLMTEVWKFNAIRVNMFPRLEANGVPNNNGDLDKLITWFTKKKMVVMLENHDFTGEYPKDNAYTDGDKHYPSMEQTTAFWRSLAATYRDNPYVWFNFLNEPGTGGLSKTDSIQRWKDVHETFIQAVRAEGANNLIVLDEHNWGQGYGYKNGDQDSAVIQEGPALSSVYGGIVYALHMYGEWDQASTRLQQYITRIHSLGLPIIIGEYGTDGLPSNTGAVRTMYDVAPRLKAGRMYWHWDGTDKFNLTTGAEQSGGWKVNRIDGSEPSNLSLSGKLIWDDNHGLYTEDGADLAVVQLAVDGTAAASGQATAAAVIQNTGTSNLADTDRFTVKFYVNDQLSSVKEAAGPLPFQQGLTVSSDVLAWHGGGASIKAVVEYAGDVRPENDERTAIADDAIPSGSPDLVIAHIGTGQDGPVSAGNAITLTAKVKNRGTVDLVNTPVHVAFKQNGYPAGWVIQNVTVPAGGDIELTSLVPIQVQEGKDFQVVAELIEAGDGNLHNNIAYQSIAVDTEAPNLLTNGSFESGLNGWMNWSNSLVVESPQGMAGSHALKVPHSGAGGDGGGQAFELKPNTTYVLGGWGKASADIPAGQELELGYKYSTPGVAGEVHHKLVYGKAEYEYKQLVFTTPAELSGGMFFIWKPKSEQGYDVYLDDLSLKEVRNLVANGSFEDRLMGWSNWTQSLETDTTRVIDGVTALKVGHTGAGGDGGGQSIALKPNTTYVLGAWGMNTDSPAAGQETEIGMKYSVPGESEEVHYRIPFNEKEYTYKSLHFTTPPELTGGTLFIWKPKAIGAGYDFYTDGIVLTEVKNPVLNAGFEAGLTGWMNWSSTLSVTKEADRVVSGLQALQVGTGGNPSAGDGGGQPMPLKPNTTYVLGAWGTHEAAIGSDHPTEIGFQYQQGGVNVQHKLSFTEGNYTYKQISFTTPAVMESPQLFIWKDETSLVKFYADNILLTEAPAYGWYKNVQQAEPEGPPAGGGTDPGPSGTGGGTDPAGQSQIVRHPDGRITIRPTSYYPQNEGLAKAVLDTEAVKLVFKNDAGAEQEVRTVEIALDEAKGADAYGVDLPVQALSAMNSNQQLMVSTELGSLRTNKDLWLAAAEAKPNGVADDMLLTIGQGKEALRAEVMKIVEDRPRVAVSLLADDKPVKLSQPTAVMEVSIPYKLGKGENPDFITILHIKDEGSSQTVSSGHYDAVRRCVVFQAAELGEYAVAYVEASFNDLKQAEWARPYIASMAAKGIIRGKSEGKYDPTASVTRSEFVHMLLRLFSFSAKEEGRSYADVPVSNPSYDAIRTASSIGLVNGTADGRFLPDASLKRQDMMVLLKRALALGGHPLPEGEYAALAPFADESELCSYAVDSASALAAAGLIQGTGNALLPNDTLTRAEAAAVIYRVYHLLYPSLSASTGE